MYGRTTVTSKVGNQHGEKRRGRQLSLALFFLFAVTVLFSNSARADSFNGIQAKRISAGENRDLHQVIGLETYRGRVISKGELKTRAQDLKGLLKKAQLETRSGEIYYPREIQNALVEDTSRDFPANKWKRAPFNDDGGFRN